jgi:hypothetical protein
MLIHRWRLALAAGALVILGAVGGGLVQAAIPSSGSAADRAASAASADAGLLDDIILAADPSAGPSAAPGSGPDRAQKLRDRLAARLGGLRKRIVHGTVSMVGAGGNLITVQLDHGTVSAVGSGSITVSEAGGGKVTVATDAATRVRKDRKRVTLADLKTGDEVLVQSTVDGAVATAKRIVVPPNAPAAPASTTPNG